MPLRLAGGLHALARRDPSSALAAIYPPRELPSDEAIWAAVGATLRTDESELLRWLDLPPQTNEPARSAALMAGLLVIAAETRLPIALYEVGASAGLNLVPDRYFCRLGETTAGPAGSRVALAPGWTGNSPPSAEVTVARRRGVDLAPLDVRASADRERLAAYVWADQRERLARVVAAVEIAASDPPAIDRGNAADWVEDVISPEPEQGIVRVLTHTIAFQYFPPETPGPHPHARRRASAAAPHRKRRSPGSPSRSIRRAARRSCASRYGRTAASASSPAAMPTPAHFDGWLEGAAPAAQPSGCIAGPETLSPGLMPSSRLRPPLISST